MRLFVFLPDQPFPNNQIQRKSEATVEIEFIVQNWHLFLALVVIVFLLSWDSAKRRFSGVKGVGATELPQLLNHEDAAVIDIRESAEFRKGHIPGAVNIPLSQLADSESKLKRYKNAGTPLVVACQTGMRAGKGAAQLRKFEIEKVYTLTGGLAAWQKENLPLQK